MRVYLSRWVCLDVDSNLARLPEEAHTAASAGASLVVFPESFLHGYTRTVEPERVRAAFAEVSAEHADVAFVFGSFSEQQRNRMTVWRDGHELARYDKVHLFAPNGEFDLWTEGDCYAAVRLGGWTWGLLNCNDLRFPEQARMLRLRARCDGLIVIGWWPWRRDHVWRTLLCARAIENACWVAGCCIAASEVPDEHFAGAGNYLFDPLGEPMRSADDHTWEIDPARARAVVVDPLESARLIEGLTVFDPAAN